MEMEGEICSYDKFGFCKYKSECQRRHYSQECEALEKCDSIRSCPKRHPKYCKMYALGQCKFSDCAYKHLGPKGNEEQNNLIEKLKKLEQVTHALTRKVLSLEKEMSEIKTNKKSTEIDEGKVIGQINKEEKSEVKDNKTVNKVFKKKKSHESADKNTNSKVTEKKEKENKCDNIKIILSCEKCEYVTNKESILKKHMSLKHEDHPCKECREKFPILSKLLNHIF